MSDQSIENLPFVRRVSAQCLDLWHVSETGEDWTEGNALGRTFAKAFADHMRASGNMPVFSHVIRAMAEKGRFGAIEIGFLTEIGRLMVQGRGQERLPGLGGIMGEIECLSDERGMRVAV